MVRTTVTRYSERFPAEGSSSSSGAGSNASASENEQPGSRHDSENKSSPLLLITLSFAAMTMVVLMSGLLLAHGGKSTISNVSHAQLVPTPVATPVAIPEEETPKTQTYNASESKDLQLPTWKGPLSPLKKKELSCTCNACGVQKRQMDFQSIPIPLNAQAQPDVGFPCMNRVKKLKAKELDHFGAVCTIFKREEHGEKMSAVPDVSDVNEYLKSEDVEGVRLVALNLNGSARGLARICKNCWKSGNCSVKWVETGYSKSNGRPHYAPFIRSDFLYLVTAEDSPKFVAKMKRINKKMDWIQPLGSIATGILMNPFFGVGGALIGGITSTGLLAGNMKIMQARLTEKWRKKRTKAKAQIFRQKVGSI